MTDLYPYVGDNIGAASVLRELGDKKTAGNFGCEYMDVDDFVYKYNNR